MQEDNSGFSLLLDLLSELYQKQPKIGYHLLYYLKARYVREGWGEAPEPRRGSHGLPEPAWCWGAPPSPRHVSF